MVVIGFSQAFLDIFHGQDYLTLKRLLLWLATSPGLPTLFDWYNCLGQIKDGLSSPWFWQGLMSDYIFFPGLLMLERTTGSADPTCGPGTADILEVYCTVHGIFWKKHAQPGDHMVTDEFSWFEFPKSSKSHEGDQRLQVHFPKLQEPAHSMIVLQQLGFLQLVYVGQLNYLQVGQWTGGVLGLMVIGNVKDFQDYGIGFRVIMVRC